MTIDEAKNLITNHNIDKNTYLPAIHSFLGEEKEENYYSLMILVGLFDIFYSEEAYKYLVILLENFKNKLDKTPQNLGYYYYGQSLIYLILGDRSRAIEFSLEAKKIDGLDKTFLYYTECFLVSALYEENLYSEALNENLYIYDNIYNCVTDEKKVSILLNFVIIYTYLNDFDNSSKFKNLVIDLLNKNNKSLYDKTEDLIYYIDTFRVLSFGNDCYDDEVINKTVDDYVEHAFQDSKSNLFYSYIDLHVAILSNLYERNRLEDVYKVCKIYINSRQSTLMNIDLYKLYVKSISKEYNLVEYISALEKYSSLLEYKNRLTKKHSQYYYEKAQDADDINFEFNKLKNDYSHDALTKCFSRAKYDSIRKSKNFGSLIYFDVNKLKVINDTFGHKFGDKYLIKFVHNIEKAMPNDSLYRIGGDEFILISNDYKKDDIIKKLEKLFRLRLFNTDDIDKFSAGIVINDTGITIQSAEERADKILYDVKNLKEEYYRFYK